MAGGGASITVRYQVTLTAPAGLRVPLVEILHSTHCHGACQGACHGACHGAVLHVLVVLLTGGPGHVFIVLTVMFVAGSLASPGLVVLPELGVLVPVPSVVLVPAL